MSFGNNNSQLPPSLDKWLSERKVKIEIILTALSALSMLIYSMENKIGAELLMITLSIQSGFYFILAYTKPETEGAFSIIVNKVISIASSVCLIGLLFAMLKLAGADEMMLIGFGALAVAGVLLLFKVLTNWNENQRPVLMRIFALVVLVGLVRFHIISF